MDFYEHIESYLAGNLSPDMQIAMEKAMKEDPVLALAVENHESAMDILDFAIEDEIRGIIDEHIEEKKDIDQATDSNHLKHDQSIFKKWWIWLIGLLLLISIMFYFNPMPKQELQFAEVYAAPAWPIERGSENSISKAILNYQAGKQKAAIDSLKSIQSEEANYWISELFLSSEQADSVLTYIPNVTAFQANKIRRDRLIYMEILAHYIQSDQSKVNTLIDQIPTDLDAYYIELIHKMD